MTKKVFPKPSAPVSKRRRFADEFRREAVQMMHDGHSAASVAQRVWAFSAPRSSTAGSNNNFARSGLLSPHSMSVSANSKLNCVGFSESVTS